MKSFAEVKKQNFEIIKKIIVEGQEKGIFKQDINLILIPSSILGPFFHFQMNRPNYEEMLDLKTDEAYDNYIKNELTKHIQQTIQSLLLHEK